MQSQNVTQTDTKILWRTIPELGSGSGGPGVPKHGPWGCTSDSIELLLQTCGVCGARGLNIVGLSCVNLWWSEIRSMLLMTSNVM